ncbi:S49 family peptidase [Methylobacterium radiodurans]|uniref:Peptidase S46 n=1 Tax=Methylobacterium radiodurans TaxID=2202828 RepID=A0A2U8VSX4_9HYPH|nr:S49 family peptidase [Methylobacterium radiodurans]AWN36528.1 peptidase S46 [Methylobacterium radiodurans]
MSGTHLVRIAEALSRPLLFHPTKLEVILSALDGRLPGFEVEAPSPEASRFAGRRDDGKPYRVADGVAFVPVVGSLANRGAYIGASSGIVSYEGIALQIRTASADSTVHAIVLDLDTPGGEATGMFRLAEQIRQARASKRVVAFVDDMAASAGYGIASQAHEIVVSPTSIVGSIGVVLAHIDRQAEMEKAGRKVTLIHAGANKVDGNPFGPLSDQVRADLQAEVLTFWGQFLATVAAGRPKLTVEKAQATEARTFIGQGAIDAGLADRIGTLDSVVSDLAARVRGTNRLPTTRAGAGVSIRSSNMDEDEKRIRSEERERIRGIVGSAEAEGRGSQALAMALETSLSAEEARAVLRASPKVSGRTSLDERMAGRQELSLDPDKAPGAERQERQAERAKGVDHASVYAARQQQTEAARRAEGGR